MACGACPCVRRIRLTEFADPDIELVAAYHELGHVLGLTTHSDICYQITGELKGPLPLCQLSAEGAAWELGLHLARLDGHHWAPGSKQLRFAYKMFMSYNTNWTYGESNGGLQGGGESPRAAGYTGR